MIYVYFLFLLLCVPTMTFASIVQLSSYVNRTHQYMNPIISGDDQHLPLYTGCKPVELELNIQRSQSPNTTDMYCDVNSNEIFIPKTLKLTAEIQIQYIIEQYLANDNNHTNNITIELWPTLGAFGFYTWVYARLIHNETHWIWIDSSLIELPESNTVDAPLNTSQYPEPYFPHLYLTSNETDYNLLFSDLLEFDSLYVKPLFGDCLWTTDEYVSTLKEKQLTKIHSGWLNVNDMGQFGNKIQQSGQHNICVLLPQPAQTNGKPYTLFVNININNSNKIEWPTNIYWYTVSSPTLNEIKNAEPKTNEWYNNLKFPLNFNDSWTKDMYQLSGAHLLEFPQTINKKLNLTRKSSIQSDNQLHDIIDYLIERYKQLNIKTERQIFTWRNITQENLIVYLPASGNSCNIKIKNQSIEPVIFIDHIDTAFEQDTFENSNYTKRQTTQGADDNVSGLVALLQSAQILQQTQLTACRDIWLVHLTGEEYPAASLGIIYFLVTSLLKPKQQIYTAVIVDMISHRVNHSDPIVQVNAADSKQSLLIAELTVNHIFQKIKTQLYTELKPELRQWSNPFAYLYNTDGVRFNEYGFTCILINEHINYHENFERDGYHDTQDTVNLIDFKYGQAVTQYAIATVAALAHSNCECDTQNNANVLKLSLNIHKYIIITFALYFVTQIV
ncbi:unnamed protein product [Didymodactylos carnosus]|uniref:Peptidase M28 domain-containing protein n=1 Tax=Didymodactylos carnosus TaxID=1234261 RepID=A0A8S2EI29_9BILA|nr:unnamed protein product [Didymodactylos carnosus]CAF3963998.1 unnamed protein product [Didymodactylos carnosus]